MIIKNMEMIFLSDLEKTIHYTTKAELICQNLCNFIPQTASLIEPFVGEGDLLRLFPNHKWETYDIQENVCNDIVQDTLNEPPIYKGKWVVTNPPFLAKNKALDKKIFNKYKLDDLYKIFLKTMLEAEGGIIIIPTNFFTDERSGLIRKEFLSNFVIDCLNIYTEPVFESTTYSVCSFACHKEKNLKQKIPTNIYPKNTQIVISLDSNYDYRIGGEFYSELSSQKNYFGRLTDSHPNVNITKLKLYALDTRKERIHISYGEEPYYGKETDRMYLTFISNDIISDDIQKELCNNFNKSLNNFRDTYYDLGMTNYRDYNRKRIGFTFAYQLLSREYEKILQKNKEEA